MIRESEMKNFTIFLLVFSGVSGLRFHIDEESPPDTEVGRIPGPLTSRTALMNHQDVFRLDPATGALRTRIPIDRDTLPRDFFDLSIANHDGSGFPALVTVEVGDVNDNAPCFPAAVVARVFLETDQIGQQVLLDAATDADRGANGRVRNYEIVQGNGAGDFRLVLMDNFLYIENLKPLDRENQENFWLNISATDSGAPGKCQSSVPLQQ